VEVAGELELEVVGTCDGGEFGATEVRARDGARLVLKVLHDLAWARLGVDMARRVRAVGFPAPEYAGVGIAAGEVYTLQAFCSGDIPDELSVELADQLLDLLPLEKGAAPEGGGWADNLVAQLRGDADWPRHDAPRAVAPSIVDELVALGARSKGLVLPEQDVVHGDYHQRNFLTVDARVSAVFDWEGAHTGDCRFDGFVLGYWARAAPDFASRDVADYVWKRATADIEPEALAVYAGHMALRNLEFFARVHPDALPWCLGTIEEILGPCWR
jgi:hypothetical protein